MGMSAVRSYYQSLEQWVSVLGLPFSSKPRTTVASEPRAVRRWLQGSTCTQLLSLLSHLILCPYSLYFLARSAFFSFLSFAQFSSLKDLIFSSLLVSTHSLTTGLNIPSSECLPLLITPRYTTLLLYLRALNKICNLYLHVYMLNVCFPLDLTFHKGRAHVCHSNVYILNT